MNPSHESPQLRVAVVGTGVSGLVAAHELHKAGHDIAVFEASSRIGGHTHTHTVESSNGPIRVDTGFIVLNDLNYPNLERLFDELGVETQKAPMSFGVSDGRGDFEWAATPGGVFAKGSHLVDRRYHRMLTDLVRFNKQAREMIGMNGDGGSLRSFCEERGFSEYFVERLIVPQASAVWSADPEQLWDFPISFLAEFLNNHGSLQLLGRPQWRSVVGGSNTYVEAITAPWRDRVRTSAAVREIRRTADGVQVVWDDGIEAFDEVVIATHSDQALRMLGDPSPAEREILGAIAYAPNETVLHTDTSVMPRRRRAWASWNFHMTDPGESAPGRATVTYDMNNLQRLDAPERFLVTLNRTEAIDPSQIIETMHYEHPVYSTDAVAAQARWGEISGKDRIHYAGAYWGWGFHEDGVKSALRAVAGIPDAKRRNAGGAEGVPLAA